MVKNNFEQNIRQRIAVVDLDACDPTRCALECMKACPVNRQGKDCIVIDEDNKKAKISEELCIGCHLCYKCPFNAITIVNLTAKLNQPIQSFGENSFRLHGLPTPKEKSVVGLIGRNGIGKSTALKILTNQLLPNMGLFNEKIIPEKVKQFFKGKELQGFFENLYSNQMSFAFKPQNIDLIPETTNGKVIDLLLKISTKEKIIELAKKLEIDSILEHDIKKVSGGELQRIAICATLLKDVDFYFFDEPTSYLDVRQRLKIAGLIRELTVQNKSVLLVEHDLAVLDYLSDYIHIVFGEQSVYGVVSKTYSVRNGINEYLEGYLSAENIRFRTKELNFSVRPPQEEIKRTKIAEYPALEKKFKDFSLKTEAGELREGEVLGILGPNAIGKTTFVKMLAGVEKPDNTEIDLKLKISYKPQYLKPEKNVLVSELFSADDLDMALFRKEINNRLNIEKLFDKKAESLSGGELQKVALSLALCRESDIILLDEPSAFIDVEDRLATADAIRSITDSKGKISMIVDHDILFQDYVSDRIIVFEGTPSQKGTALKPMPMEQGMNHFLKSLGITYRRDPKSGRPRANKPGSVKDQEQKKSGNYYYS